MNLKRNLELQTSAALLSAFGLLWYVSVLVVKPGDVRPESYPAIQMVLWAFIFLVPVVSPFLLGMLLVGYFRAGRKSTVWVCAATILTVSTIILSAQYVVSLVRR